MIIEFSGLFFSAYLASTLLPGGSEIALVYMAHHSQLPIYLLIITATLGNTLGGMTSWFMGWYCAKHIKNTRFHRPKYQRATLKLQQWGSPILLFSWVPIIGDPLCLAAGWLNLAWRECLIYIALGKGLRYIIIISLFSDNH